MLAQEALSRSNGKYVEAVAALALGMAGGGQAAQGLVNDLERRFPEDTLVKFNYLPAIRGAVALERNNSSNAIEELQTARLYELGETDMPLSVVYIRGKAYLASGQGREASVEFQKILDHRSIVHIREECDMPFDALAHLGLARAYALQGNSQKARSAYQGLLNLWQDADPDLPVLQQAKAELRRIQ